MKIRMAEERDPEQIAEIYEHHFDYEDANGTMTQWNRGIYPSLETAENAYRNGWLIVYEDGGRVLGSIIVNSEQTPIYGEVDWAYPAEGDRVAVLHTLCVEPAEWGHGIGTKLVAAAEDHARRNGAAVCRLDTWTGNRASVALYTGVGYEYAGHHYAEYDSVLPSDLYFYEKKL
ncbi:MAG: GNAT family N-acetyltransferase [Anaerovoracaceae bacterium]|jgi:GNAT superfamily N-acetyltransferase